MAASHDMWTRLGFIGLGDWMAGMQAIRQTFVDGRISLDEYSEAIRAHSQAVMLQRREYMATRTAWRMEHQALLETMRAFRDVAGIGRLITSTFQTYTMMMLRVERQQRDVTDATREVADAQFGYDRMVRIFGSTSTYAIKAHEDLMKAQLDEEESMKRLSEIQEQNRFGMVGIGLQAIEIAPRLVYLVMHVRLLQQWLEKSGGATYALTMGIGALKSSLPGIISLLGGLASALLPIAGAGMILAGFLLPEEEKARQVEVGRQARMREAELLYQTLGQQVGGVISFDIDIGEIRTEADYLEFLDRLQRDLYEIMRERE